MSSSANVKPCYNSDTECHIESSDNLSVNTIKCIETITEICDGSPVIFSTGFISRYGYNLSDKKSHFYMVGSMGLATSIGIGLALNKSKSPVIVIVVDDIATI